jgi:hypothetical protein
MLQIEELLSLPQIHVYVILVIIIMELIHFAFNVIIHVGDVLFQVQIVLRVMNHYNSERLVEINVHVV